MSSIQTKIHFNGISKNLRSQKYDPEKDTIKKVISWVAIKLRSQISDLRN